MSDLSNDASQLPSRGEEHCVSVQIQETRYRLQFQCADPVKARRVMGTVAAWLGMLERLCSRAKPDSLVSRINHAAGRDWVEIDPEMERLLSAADTAFRLTGGLLNAAALPLRQLWKQRKEEGRTPDEGEIAEALALSNWQAIQRQPGRVFLPRAGMGLDLDILSRKYAVDMLTQLLRQQDIESALVQAGGDVFALGGAMGKNAAWRVGCEQGIQTAEDTALVLSDEAACCVSLDDSIVDSRTGRPPVHDLRAVTVVGPNCLTAGSYAASMIVLGQREGLRLAESAGMVEACLLSEAGAAVTTRGFSRLIRTPEAPVADVVPANVVVSSAKSRVAKKWLARDLIRLWPWLLPVVLLLITFGPAGLFHSGTQPGAAAAAFGMVWMTYFITRRLWGHYRGHAASTMLMFTLGLFAIGWLPMPDMTLCFLTLAAIAALVHQRAWVFFTLLGLSFLIKGPVTVLVPTSAALGWWLVGGRREGRVWLPGTGIALAVSLAALFWKGTPAVALAHTGAPEGLEGAWWHFLPMLFLALMPWSFCTPRVVRQGWRRLRTGTLQARHGLLIGWLLPALTLTPGGLVASALLLVPALVIAFCPPLADARRLWRIGTAGLSLWLASGLLFSTAHSNHDAPATVRAPDTERVVREIASGTSFGSFTMLNRSLPISAATSHTLRR